MILINSARKVSIVCTSKNTNSSNNVSGYHYPFVSVIVATYNESLVIERFIKSLSELTYPVSRFEIIIVDDSTDDTYDKITKLSKNLPNLKAAHRENRSSWKGGALNMAIDLMDKRTSLVMVLDADSILINDVLERFISRLTQADREGSGVSNQSIAAVQGFPVPKCNSGDNNSRNWIARGINLRLAQRNVVEFSTKSKSDLPVQITGSLFMIKADILRATKFHSDLCEDWDLTLDLHLQAGSNYHYHNNQNSSICLARPKILFDPSLVSYCEATSSLVSYLRQRMRVSEGHTRGFRKRIRSILKAKGLSIRDKLEIILTGLRYARFIAIPVLAMIDIAAVMLLPPHSLLSYSGVADSILSSSNNYYYIIMLLSIQAATLFLETIGMFMATKICSRLNRYGSVDALNLLALDFITIPVLVIGAICGFLRDSGSFYKTERNATTSAYIRNSSSSDALTA